jgi:hypothetical protein
MPAGRAGLISSLNRYLERMEHRRMNEEELCAAFRREPVTRDGLPARKIGFKRHIARRKTTLFELTREGG